MFHVASKQARDDLRRELGEYLAQYREASEALRSGNLEAASWFPEGCYPPALAFVGQRPSRGHAANLRSRGLASRGQGPGRVQPSESSDHRTGETMAPWQAL